MSGEPPVVCALASKAENVILEGKQHIVCQLLQTVMLEKVVTDNGSSISRLCS